MKHFYIILLIIILTPFVAIAQSNYKPGYVVTLKGDTLHGFIDFREWDSNPNEINFKTAIADNRAQKFTPGMISFFNIDSLIAFQRYAGVISMDATDANHISNGKDASFKIDTVFLKVLQKGKNIIFYSYFDGFKTRFYIADRSDYLPAELGYHLYTISDASPQSGTVVDNAYMKQLFASAQKYGVLTDELQIDIQHAEYAQYGILPIVSKINGISKEDYKKRYSTKTKIRLFADAALNITTIKPTRMYKATGGKTETSYFPALSLGVDVFANPSTGKLLFRLEGMYTQNQYKSLTIYTGSPFVPTRYSYDQHCLSLSPQVIYNFYKKDDKAIYAGIGGVITSYSYSNATYDINYAGTKVSNAHLKTENFFYTYGASFVFKAGAKFDKHWGVFVSYFTGNSVTTDIPFSLEATAVHAGLSYDF